MDGIGIAVSIFMTVYVVRVAYLEFRRVQEDTRERSAVSPDSVVVPDLPGVVANAKARGDHPNGNSVAETPAGNGSVAEELR